MVQGNLDPCAVVEAKGTGQTTESADFIHCLQRQFMLQFGDDHMVCTDI